MTLFPLQYSNNIIVSNISNGPMIIRTCIIKKKYSRTAIIWLKWDLITKYPDNWIIGEKCNLIKSKIHNCTE